MNTLKPQDLRIGNIVCRWSDDPKKIFVTEKDESEQMDITVVDEIHSDRVGVFNDGNYNSPSFFETWNLNEIKPVPLTEKWLLNFGFTKGDGDIYNKYFFWIDSRPLIILVNPENGSTFIEERGVSVFEVKVTKPILYVHDLQNIYFALTGRELEVNGGV